jgi:chromosome segregation ATPase
VFLSFADLEACVDQLKASKTDLKNIVYREKDACEVLEYEYKQLSHECVMHMELREALDRDLVNCYKSLQKLNQDCEKLCGQLKELEEATLPIGRLLVPYPGGPKMAPIVEQVAEKLNLQ